MSRPQKNLEFWKKSDLGPVVQLCLRKVALFKGEKKTTFSRGNLYKRAHPITASTKTAHLQVLSWSM